jgi:hypothetical protein
MQLYSDFNLLSVNLDTLSDPDEALQASAAKEVRVHLEAAARELSLTRFANFENELFASIFLKIISGDNVREKRGGVMAIREMIACTSAAVRVSVFCSLCVLFCVPSPAFPLPPRT